MPFVPEIWQGALAVAICLLLPTLTLTWLTYQRMKDIDEERREIRESRESRERRERRAWQDRQSYSE